MSYLTPLKNKITNKKIYAFDIETIVEPDNVFLMGSIGDENHIKIFWEQEEMIEHIINTDKYRFNNKSLIFATNLHFDILCLLKNTDYISDFEFLIKNGKMLRAIYKPNDKHKKIVFYDTLNFSMTSVEKAGKMIGINKLKKPSFLGKKPKDYFKKIELEKYNTQDTLITCKFAEFLQKGFNNFGCNMKLTIASTSMDLFRRKYLKNFVLQPKINDMLQSYEAYYGGRTEVISRGHFKNVNVYDINSLYPFKMLDSFPNPNTMKKIDIANFNIINEYEGITKVDISRDTIHKQHPLIPVKKDNKLLFPNGYYRGWYTNLELRNMIQLGYNIDKFYDGYYYTHNHYPFKDFSNDLYNERLRYKKNNNPEEHTLKILMNSLYGKFAQKITGQEKIYHIDNLNEEQYKKFFIDDNPNLEISIVDDFVYVKEKVSNYIPRFINPIYSIYITAKARIELYKYMNKLGNKVLYVDTDSVFTKSEIETSSKIGGMKHEYLLKDCVLIKPKMYLGQTKDKDIIKIKGFTLHDENGNLRYSYDEIKNKLANEEKFKVEFQRFIKFKESLRRHLCFNQLIVTPKEYNLNDNKRMWWQKFSPDDNELSMPRLIHKK